MKTMKQVLTGFATGLVAVMALTGCGSNSGGNNNNNTAVGYNACPGCVGNTQLLTTASSVNQNLGEGLQLQFFGTSGSTYAGYTSGQYSQVAAQGVLTIGSMAQQCGLPQGQYSVSTSGAPAVMSGNIINNMTMTGSGPTSVMMQITRVYFVSPTQMQVNGTMYGQIPSNPCSFVYYAY